MFSLWKITRAAFDATSKLLHVQLRGAGDEGDDEAAEPVDDAPVLSQLGVAVRPVVAATLRALGYQDGDEVWVLKAWDKARSPTDLEVGETRLYAAGAIATVVRLLTTRVVLEAPEIRLGASATKRVARVGDRVRVTVPSGTSFALTIPGVGAVTASTTAPVTCDGEVTTGSSKVRAED